MPDRPACHRFPSQSARASPRQHAPRLPADDVVVGCHASVFGEHEGRALSPLDPRQPEACIGHSAFHAPANRQLRRTAAAPPPDHGRESVARTGEASNVACKSDASSRARQQNTAPRTATGDSAILMCHCLSQRRTARSSVGSVWPGQSPRGPVFRFAPTVSHAAPRRHTQIRRSARVSDPAAVSAVGATSVTRSLPTPVIGASDVLSTGSLIRVVWAVMASRPVHAGSDASVPQPSLPIP